MPDYDFHTLSPLDFEELSRDLIQARDGVVLESFKVGREHGVDFRLAWSDETLVVQCKHFRKSGFRALLCEVKKAVAPRAFRVQFVEGGLETIWRRTAIKGQQGHEERSPGVGNFPIIGVLPDLGRIVEQAKDDWGYSAGR